MMCNETRYGRRYGCRILNKYDYASISHYPNVLGDRIKRVIIMNKTSCGEGGCQFGQRLALSPLDVKDIQKLYNCGKLVTYLNKRLRQEHNIFDCMKTMTHNNK